MSHYKTLGILAHVDAGKTTLSEALLYLSGSIRKAGRVDHGDTFLDTYALEKERGITIFAKQAQLPIGAYDVTLLDTPGHADFSPEMERTLQVLDAAILVISAADGVTGQVKVLWKLLQVYHVPTFLFINKMDQPGMVREEILSNLKENLSENLLDFGEDLTSGGAQEALAMCDEHLLEHFLAGEEITAEQIRRLIAMRRLYPCLFGSALKMEGVQELIEVLAQYLPERKMAGRQKAAGASTGAADRYVQTGKDAKSISAGTTGQASDGSMQDGSDAEKFGARVYKISRDASGTRLTWMKITGGVLRAKEVLAMEIDGEEVREKADQLRRYSGEKYEMLQEAQAGQIVAVTGLTKTYAGQGIGAEAGEQPRILQPILNCSVILPEDCDRMTAYRNLRLLAEEEPELSVSQNEATGELHVQVMGQVQMEILKTLVKERFGMDIGFGPGRIVYKETIQNTVEGVGHFEPLRHYAEVHLLLSPGEPGSGLVFESDCKLDDLDRNWQRLILTHLAEKKHVGVLTGSEITDLKITLVGGRAHTKHTEGGDFREATYRAVRQGLMMAESVLLEPVLDYELELPGQALGRALNDIQRMQGTNLPPDLRDGKSVLKGTVPAATLGNYAEEVTSYTHGEGRLFVTFHGYEPCHNAEEVIEASGYYPEFDTENPASSVFCSHGVGTIIPWDEVRGYMHVDTGWRPEGTEQAVTDRTEDAALATFRAREKSDAPDTRTYKERRRDYEASEAELNAIFERTYGPIKSRVGQQETGSRTVGVKDETPRELTETERKTQEKYEAAREAKKAAQLKSYLLVDGYNVIYASERLKSLAHSDMKAARDSLMDILSNFQGFRSEQVILVFDAYKVSGGQERVFKYHNLDVVFTREAETADAYIMKTSHELSHKGRVTVATSDAVEQVIAFGGGALRMSARDFWAEIAYTEQQIRDML